MMFFSVAEFGSLVVGLQLCHPFGVGFGSLVHYSSTIISPLRGWVGSLVHSLFVYNYVSPSGLGLVHWFIIRLQLSHPFGVGLVHWFIHYSSTIMSPLRGWVGSLVHSLFVYNYVTPSGLGWFIGSFIIRLQLCHPFGVELVHSFIHYSSTIMSPLRGWVGSL